MRRVNDIRVFFARTDAEGVTIHEDWSAFGTNPDVTSSVLTAVTDAGVELVIGDGALSRTDGTDDHELAA